MLSPQERFNQLLSFLKDPQAYPHPTLSLDDPVWLEGRTHSAGEVKEFRQEAIEIMESGMFEVGCLKGNQKVKNIPIEHIETFISEMAAAYRIAKTSDHWLDYDNRPKGIEELNTKTRNLLMHFDCYVKEMLAQKLNTPKELAQARGALWKVINAAATRCIKHDIFKYGLVKELIYIFLRFVHKPPINLIAYHIYHFLDKMQQDNILKIYVPLQEALRTEIRRKIKPS